MHARTRNGPTRKFLTPMIIRNVRFPIVLRRCSIILPAKFDRPIPPPPEEVEVQAAVPSSTGADESVADGASALQLRTPRVLKGIAHNQGAVLPAGVGGKQLEGAQVAGGALRCCEPPGACLLTAHWHPAVRRVFQDHTSGQRNGVSRCRSLWRVELPRRNNCWRACGACSDRRLDCSPKAGSSSGAIGGGMLRKQRAKKVGTSGSLQW